jgi:diguanylate cyclase (GGDEF)-like protein
MHTKTPKTLLTYLDRQSQLHVMAVSYGLIAVLGFVDYLTGPEIAFSVFYFLPVALSTYFVSRQAGLVVAVVSAVVWFLADRATGHIYTQPLAAYWNTLMRLVSFVVVALLLALLRETIDHEKLLARSDFLTGAANARSFFEMAKQEINRSLRYRDPFSVIHIDVDNFKEVNDTLGHSAGDDLLCLIVRTMQVNLRETDIVARLGGDEFAVLLLQADQERAKAVAQKAQQKLMEAVGKDRWPVSFSLGVLTCLATPETVDEFLTVDDLLKAVDKLTYSAKHSGKNTIKHGVVGGLRNPSDLGFF